MFLTEEIKATIRSVFSAMANDYGRSFTGQFEKRMDLTPNKWMWRLAHELEPHNPTSKAIIEGTDAAISACTDKPPTIPQLVTAIVDRNAELRRYKQELERVKQVEQLPPPEKNSVDPLEILQNAGCAKKSSYNSKEKIDGLLRDHERLIARGRALGTIRVPTVSETALCCVPGCQQIGVLTLSTVCSENWYCRKHQPMLS